MIKLVGVEHVMMAYATHDKFGKLICKKLEVDVDQVNYRGKKLRKEVNGT